MSELHAPAKPPSPARQVLAIAGVNLVRLSRDRLGLFFIVVLPLLIILLFGVAAGASRNAAAVGVAAGSGPLEQDLVTRLESAEAITVRSYEQPEALEADVRRRVVTAGIVVPDGYDERLRDGESLAVDLIVDPSGTVPSALRASLTGIIAAENTRVQTAQFAASQMGVDFEEGLRLADETAADDGATVRPETVGGAGDGADASPVDRSAAANLVLFVFITSLVGSAALVESRRLGVSRRMLAAPASARVILGGEALGRFVIAMLQGLIIIAGASLLFGAQWQSPVAVWVVVALLSLVGTGAAMLLGARMATAEQASGLAVPLGIGLGMLGGTMWPLEIVPAPMRALGHLTPHAWAMNALNGIVGRSAGLAEVWPNLVVLALFAAVLLAAAAWQLQRTLVQAGGRRSSAHAGAGRIVDSAGGDQPPKGEQAGAMDAPTDISVTELALAARNHGMPLEMLAHDVTPIGLHYLLIHYDIPAVDPTSWQLTIGGNTEQQLTLSLDDLRSRPAVTVPVTLECAGNGRAMMHPRPVSQPWLHEAVGTGMWTGTPLAPLLYSAGLRSDTVEYVFTGLDQGVEGGTVQRYERSLTVAHALDGDVLVAYALNGQPLPPQHGFPARLIVPGWYGMASVKWLAQITAVTEPFQGYQQARAYRLRQADGEVGAPLDRIAVRALMAPPGIPEFPSRRRHVALDGCRIEGRAWGGEGPIERVEVSADRGETWHAAEVAAPVGEHAWQAWTFQWRPDTTGDFEVWCRATDAAGNTQPIDPVWNLGGYAGNAVQRVAVTVGD